MAVFTDVFGGSAVQPSAVAYAPLVLTANVVTVWPQYATTQQALARIMEIVSSTGAFSISLPDATLSSLGQDVLFNNKGANTVSILDFSGNSIATLTPGQVRYLYLDNTSTQSGIWQSVLFGAASSNLDASSLAGSGVVATGSALSLSVLVSTITSNQTLQASDRAKAFVATGGSITVTLPPAATVNAAAGGYFVEFRNQGSGALTVAAAGSDLIDGSASIALQVSESCLVHVGTGNWYTVGRGRNAQFNFTQLSKTVTGGTSTLTLSEAANVVQTYSGTLLSNQSVVLPAVVQVYYISNKTTGAFNFQIQSPTAGTTLSLPSGQNAVVFCDGTNVINASTSVSGISSLLLNAGVAASPSLGIGATNNGLFAPTGSTVGVSNGGTEATRWSGGQQQSPSGSAAAPTYSFLAAGSAGMWNPGPNQLAFSAGGLQVGMFNAAGFGIGKTPTAPLDVLGNALVSGSVTASSFTGSGSGLTGTAAGLTVGTVATNANLTGPITSVGNATTVASQTGSGSTFVMSTSPTLVTPNIGAATGTSLAVTGGLNAAGTSTFGGGAIKSTSLTYDAGNSYTYSNGNHYIGSTTGAITFVVNNTVGGTYTPTGQFIVNGTTGNNSANRLLVKGAVGDDRIAVETANTGSLASLEAQDTGYYTTPTYSGTAIVQYGAAYAGTTAGVANAGLGALRFQNNTGGLIYTNGSSPIVLATAGAERMRISSSGQVGVGMGPNGNSQLQVSQASSPYGFELLAATGGTNVGLNVMRLLNAANTVERMTIAATSDTFSYIGAASQFALFTAGAERMRIAPTGEVGIGGAPAGSVGLTVYGTNGQVMAKGTGGWGGFYAQGSTTNTSFMFFGNVTNGEAGRIEGNPASGGILLFSTGSAATERLRLSASGAAVTGPLSATGTVTGSNLSGTNTGDSAANTTYAADYRAANFVAGTNYLAPTGSAAGLTGLLSGQVTTALGFTPYNATNPSGYISSVPWATPGAIGSTTPNTGVFTSLTGSTIQDTAGNELGFKGLPSASVTTGAFIASDRGKCVYATAGVTVPNATMATGDVVTIINTTAAAVTITATVTTLRLAGVGTTGSRTLAAYGIASVVFNSSTSAFISGNVT